MCQLDPMANPPAGYSKRPVREGFMQVTFALSKNRAEILLSGSTRHETHGEVVLAAFQEI